MGPLLRDATPAVGHEVPVRPQRHCLRLLSMRRFPPLSKLLRPPLCNIGSPPLKPPTNAQWWLLHPRPIFMNRCLPHGISLRRGMKTVYFVASQLICLLGAAMQGTGSRFLRPSVARAPHRHGRTVR
jgi:hypothetical protein